MCPATEEALGRAHVHAICLVEIVRKARSNHNEAEAGRFMTATEFQAWVHDPYGQLVAALKDSLTAAGVEPSGPLRHFLDASPPVEIDDELEEQLCERYTTANLQHVDSMTSYKSLFERGYLVWKVHPGVGTPASDSIAEIKSGSRCRVFVRDRRDRPKDKPSDREPTGPIGYHFSVDVLLEHGPKPYVKCFGVTCRREDRRWVTDVKHYQDSMGRIVLTGKPVTAYDNSCPSYSKLFDLIDNVKEVQEVTAAYSVEGC